MTPSLIEEFIQALDEEIAAIKRGKGGSIVKVYNGRFLRQVSSLFVYVFHLENFLAVLDDSPAEIEIGGQRFSAQVLLTQGLEVEIGLEQFCGKFISEAKLHTNLWYLLELLKKKFFEQSGTDRFSLSEQLFSNVSIPPSSHVESSLNYTISSEPPNEAQKSAISASFSNKLCIIWGPPGTGKTKTIASAIEAHLNAGRRALLVSHANNAVDEALEDVAKHLKETRSPFYHDGKMIRLGKPQHEHEGKMKDEIPLVLLEGIAAKLGKSLNEEKFLLENKRMQIDEKLLQFGLTLKTIERIGVLESESSVIEKTLSDCKNRLSATQNELNSLKENQNINRRKLDESKTSGALKRFFKGLDPAAIQRVIDQTSISIDSKARILGELNTRCRDLSLLLTNKQQEIDAHNEEIDTFLRQVSLSESGLIEKAKELEKQKDVLLARIGEINKQLEEIQKKILSDAKLIATTLTKTFSAKDFPAQPFDVLILDEASMAPLPFLYWAAGRCREFVTVVGDFLQLPPICISGEPMAKKWLGRSIFDVLGIRATGVKKACTDPRVRLLDTQYRMVPEISEICNRLFYQDQLKDDSSTLNNRLDDGVSTSAIVLVETKKMNPWCSRLAAGGRFNLYHALTSATLAKRLIPIIQSIRQDPKNSNCKVGIVTPYAAQARLIDKIAQDWKIQDLVRVSTVHKFQGGEEPIIIFDTAEGHGTRIAPMLDDTKSDSDAHLLLNVAISRAKSKLYLIANSDYLTSQLPSDSSLSRITEHFLKEATTIESEKLVDNYFTTDFEKWAEMFLKTSEPERAPISGEFYTEKNFWPQFFQDLKTIQKRALILSPFLSIRRSSGLVNYFRVIKERGADITIYTRPKNQQIGEMANQADIVIKQLRDLGAKVVERRSMHQKVAIIDDTIAWEGSLNILSHRDTGEQMRRFEGKTAIEEIIKGLELDEENSTGTQTEEKCPGSKLKPDCDGYLVVRTKFGRKFYGCSNYPRCNYTRPIDGTTGKQKYPRKRR